MKCYNRIIAFFLVFAMLLSMLTFASAAESSGVLEDRNSVAAWNTYIASNIKKGASASSAQAAFWSNRNQVLSNAGLGKMASYDQLAKATAALERTTGGLVLQIADFITDAICSLFQSPDYLVMYDSNFGCFRPYDNRTGLWVVNSLGHFPYYPVDKTGESSGSSDATQQLSYQWINTSKIKWDGSKAIVSYTELKDILGSGYEGYLKQRENFLHIYDPTGKKVLCTEEGYPLSAIADMDNTAVNTPNNYYTEPGDTTNIYDQGDTTNNQFIDITDNSVWFPDGTLQYIDSLTYDESTKTYYVDSHDSYTFNTETNSYVTNNYSWSYTYHINYTSVTYIGQTEEYDKEYQYYYELPDGRSSADLTAEDLLALNTSIDVVPYVRSTDDVSMRVLYHFDGNTQDSSYWSYCTDFDWIMGASLTYMDEGTFNGSLYLDETAHQFSITLPGERDLVEDFTLQFRYYQSYTPTPVTDSYIAFGDGVAFRWTGAEYLNASGAVIGQTSIGTWNELCIVKEGSVLRYYINGIYVSSSAVTINGNSIHFYFGNDQQTYKKLDELRFTRGALYGTSGYQCTAVPYDTNLTLILPDGEQPVADEYAVLVESENNMLADDYFVSYLYSGSYVPDVMNFEGYVSPDHLYYLGSVKTVTKTENGYLLEGFNTVNPTYAQNLFLPISRRSANVFYNILPIGTYTLSIVFVDGTVHSLLLNVAKQANGNNYTVTTLVDSGMVQFAQGKYFSSTSGGYARGLELYFPNYNPVEIAYVELVEGSSYDFRWEYETAVFSSGELENFPVLAVRTNQTITGHQIGGIRPSYPEEGLVYALVEGNYITSLQIYNGQAWESVDGRIWTGSRWVPYYAYDVVLLNDMYDIIEADPTMEYIYTESGFWAWFQKAWAEFMGKLDQIIALLSGSGTESECIHDYSSETAEPTCSTPGGITYTCDLCGHSYTDADPALGHDWVVMEDVPTTYDLPADAHCPNCESADFTYALNASKDEFACSCTICSTEWAETPVVTYGHTDYVCSRCDAIQTESHDPEDNDLFSALGNFLADGVKWVTDKLTQAVNGLNDMLTVFQEYAENMKEKVGEYPAFLAAVVAVMPQDLMDALWFGLIAGLIVLVLKKVF